MARDQMTSLNVQELPTYTMSLAEQRLLKHFVLPCFVSMNATHTENISSMVIHSKFSKAVVIYFSYIELSQAFILHPAAVCDVQQRYDAKPPN